MSINGLELKIDNEKLQNTKDLLESIIGGIEEKSFIQVIKDLSNKWSGLNTEDQKALTIALTSTEKQEEFEELLKQLKPVL